MCELIDQRIPVLDHGHVILLDYMGSDADIAAAARTSYQGGTRQVSDDRKLIRYLMRHRHTTPFEMASLKFHIKLPIFVERQWIRHRTFSTNEVSARYSVLSEEAYLPALERFAGQSTDNKQGSGEPLTPVVAKSARYRMEDSYDDSFGSYGLMLRNGVARELARLPLPVATYTEKVWMGNLHNLLHFLQLRLDEHAQWEIRQYAKAIAGIVEQLFPATWEAFVDYRLEAMTFSKQELLYLAHILPDGHRPPDGDLGMSDRERGELLAKVQRIFEMRGDA